MTDWPKLIADLTAYGVTPYRLAWTVHVDYKTILAYAEGRVEPRHSVGETIIALHAAIPLGVIPLEQQQ